jgi:hypothetical protein
LVDNAFKFSPTGSYISGFGAAGWLEGPSGIAFSGANLYVSEPLHDAIRVIELGVGGPPGDEVFVRILTPVLFIVALALAAAPIASPAWPVGARFCEAPGRNRRGEP